VVKNGVMTTGISLFIIITGVVTAGLAYGLLAEAFGHQIGLYPSRSG
jgi:hypothetical protein